MATSKAFILVLSCLYMFSYVLAARELSDTAMAEIHEKWMGRYGRVYKDADEKARRFEVFRDNIAFIESFNAGNNKFWLEANQFADLTNDEFRAARTNKGWKQNMAKVPTRFKYENVSTDAFPADRGLEDQGSCHSLSRIEANVLSCCWAFPAVAATEGIVKLSMGQLISLSEQELVDCDTHSMDEGRDGGEKESAFEFIIKNGGLATESSSPYKAEDGGTCKNGSQIAATIKGYEDVPANNEAALIKAVAHQPVSVAVDTGDKTFQRYSGGVMTVSCSTDLDHAIAVVGYGIESDGTKYWILKNSWGTSWGEKEYYFRFKI